MSDWVWISIIFGLMALWVWKYEPKMLVEHEDGRVTFEHVHGTSTNLTERVRVILALGFLYLFVLAVNYHEFLWELFWQYMNLQ